MTSTRLRPPTGSSAALSSLPERLLAVLVLAQIKQARSDVLISKLHRPRSDGAGRVLADVHTLSPAKLIGFWLQFGDVPRTPAGVGPALFSAF